MTEQTYEAVVVGAGILGLSSLYHLLRLGCRRVALVEQFELGHARGSSHGTSRITRSSYDRTRYVRLVQVAHKEEWPRLERDSGQSLIHPAPGCFWGPLDGDIVSYADAVLAAGVQVDCLTSTEAQTRFPMIRFEEGDMAISDPTCAVVAAERVLQALTRQCAKANIMTNTGVLRLDVNTTPITVFTSRGVLKTQRLIVAAGAWAARLIPALAPHLTVIRQHVGYFEMDGEPTAFEVGHFPVWVYLGKNNDHVYGLPQFQTPGIKVARHVTHGEPDSPDTLSSMPNSQSMDGLRRFLDHHFVPKVRRLAHAETCLYTNTKSTDYILDLHPENRAVAVGAGLSGHGFKLGPLSGRILAELVMKGKTSVPEFESVRSSFMIPMSES